MSAEFPQFNLLDVLASEAKSALQLWLNLEYLSGHSYFGGGAAPEWFTKQWPIPTTVYYEEWDGNGSARYVRMENIRMSRAGDIEWADETVHDRVVDVAYERRYNVPAGAKQTATYSYKLGGIRTREEGASLSLENEIKLRLGGTTSPAGAENRAVVKASVEQKYGVTQSFEETFADATELTGPIDVILRGQRSRALVSQVTKSVPIFEYDLYIGKRSGGIAPTGYDARYWIESHFGSKSEFNAFIQGRTSDDVGVVYQYTTRVGKEQLRTWNMAEQARNHRQVDTVITNQNHALIFSSDFDDNIQQGTVFFDAKTNEQIDPHNYHPGG